MSLETLNPWTNKLQSLFLLKVAMITVVDQGNRKVTNAVVLAWDVEGYDTRSARKYAFAAAV